MEKEPGTPGSVFRLAGVVEVITPDGPVMAESFDWIVQDWEGNLWVWADAGFRATFVPLDAARFATKPLLDWKTYDQTHGR